MRVGPFVPQQRDPRFLQLITLVMGQKQQLLWDLPPAETYAMNRAIYDLPRAQADETQKTLVELLDIGDLIGKPTRQLSLGERMKCELVAALLHRPRVLFLDEPTIGLDVSMQAKMREFIRDYNQRFGAAVLLTSHYMDDVTALCPRVIVIDHGHLIYDGDLQELVRRVRPDKRVSIRLSAPIERAQLDKLGVVVSADAAQVVLSVPAVKVNVVVRDALATLPVVDLTIEDPPLEEVMREMFSAQREARATERCRDASAARSAPTRRCCAWGCPRSSPTAPSSWSGSSPPTCRSSCWRSGTRSRADGAVGRFDQKEFTAYYLAVQAVRLLTSTWVVWQMSMEIRDGTLSAKLLRPVHPLFAYSAEHLAAVPLRALVVSPIVAILVYTAGDRLAIHDPALLAIFLASLLGAWLLIFFTMVLLGALAFYMESALGLFELWLGIHAIFSGYLIPLEVLPSWIRGATRVLPFRYMLGFPVETLVGLETRAGGAARARPCSGATSGSSSR